jgi:branched-chain amino acid transport system substrate-binding protein
MANKSAQGITRRAGLGLLAGAGAAAPLLGRGLGSDLTIGALLSLTGDWSTLGIASQALLEIAVAEINAFFEATQAPGRVSLRVEDTRLEPERAVNAFKSLTGAGASLIIGPQSSAECRAILPLLGEAGVIAISQGSTAGSLSFPNDFLYRFVPDDAVEGEALVAAASALATHTIIPVWRADPGNRGIAIAVRRGFTAIGGTVTAGVEYPTEKEDFPAVVRQIVSQLPAGWRDAGGVTVQVSAFDEIVQLFQALSAVPGLSKLRWLGSDGLALSAPLLKDSVAANFAVETRFLAPTLLRSTESKPKWEPLVKAASGRSGVEPDAFALAAYDACWCGVLARSLNGGNYGPTLRTYLRQSAELFHGATGWCRLNDNGDRATGSFEFWGLAKEGSATQWKSMATYDGGVYQGKGLGSISAG